MTTSLANSVSESKLSPRQAQGPCTHIEPAGAGDEPKSLHGQDRMGQQRYSGRNGVAIRQKNV